MGKVSIAKAVVIVQILVAHCQGSNALTQQLLIGPIKSNLDTEINLYCSHGDRCNATFVKLPHRR